MTKLPSNIVVLFVICGFVVATLALVTATRERTEQPATPTTTATTTVTLPADNHPAASNKPYVAQVDLPDGRRVPCVFNAVGGLVCDWSSNLAPVEPAPVETPAL